MKVAVGIAIFLGQFATLPHHALAASTYEAVEWSQLIRFDTSSSTLSEVQRIALVELVKHQDRVCASPANRSTFVKVIGQVEGRGKSTRIAFDRIAEVSPQLTELGIEPSRMISVHDSPGAPNSRMLSAGEILVEFSCAPRAQHQ